MSRLEFNADRLHPMVRLWFGYSPKRLELVKALPGRKWSPADKCWIVDATGALPPSELAGHLLIDDEPDTLDLDDFWLPLAKAVPDSASGLLYPRLAGKDNAQLLLGGVGAWNEAMGAFVAPLASFADFDSECVQWDCDTRARAIEAAKHAPKDHKIDAHLDHAAGNLAVATGVDDGVDEASEAELVAKVGDLPEWWKIDLYPYQRYGALAGAGGRNLICDQPGLGKTFQGLAAAAICGLKRVVVICPPVTTTHWARSVAASGWPGEVTVWVAGRKTRPLEGDGVLVVPDSLLAARPVLLGQILAWGADGVIYDEAHRAKNPTSKRFGAVHGLVAGLPGVRVWCLSGTPLFASPYELLSLLDITGDTRRVFGSRQKFLDKYCYQNFFKAWVPRKKSLPGLKEILDSRVWVRRHKADVLSELPDKQFFDRLVDVDLAQYRAAHKEVAERVQTWLDNHRDAGLGDVEVWASGNIGLTSPLRRAAGLSKVKVAADYIKEWVDDDSNGPLVVWCWHHEVIDGLVEAIGSDRCGVVDGRTPDHVRDEVVDDFQAGRLGVFIGQISAAGVGLTLTAAADALFVESDWTPGLVEQACDRIHRIGAKTSVVSYTFLVARGTLDERMAKVIERKASTVGKLLGDGVGPAGGGVGAVSPAEIIVEIAKDLLAKKRK